ncbi:hypothetical protein A0128_06140 [Leptospira tipperaryensis]|uniref:Uncharacterized protein n=1 Tax=Leptospira tipperaryensis TaxID=2564040 RepID=A0A1D7UV28_9LEPT|nr:hypothetical protein A0128_06140 [Leptospira tipperaryensis]
MVEWDPIETGMGGSSIPSSVYVNGVGGVELISLEDFPKEFERNLGISILPDRTDPDSQGRGSSLFVKDGNENVFV